MPQFLSTADADFDARFASLLSMKREDAPDVDDAVAAIIADVRARGDSAVCDLTIRFDRFDLTPETMRITDTEIAAAADRRAHALYRPQPAGRRRSGPRSGG